MTKYQTCVLLCLIVGDFFLWNAVPFAVYDAHRLMGSRSNYGLCFREISFPNFAFCFCFGLLLRVFAPTLASTIVKISPFESEGLQRFNAHYPSWKGLRNLGVGLLSLGLCACWLANTLIYLVTNGVLLQLTSLSEFVFESRKFSAIVAVCAAQMVVGFWMLLKARSFLKD